MTPPPDTNKPDWRTILVAPAIVAVIGAVLAGCFGLVNAIVPIILPPILTPKPSLTPTATAQVAVLQPSNTFVSNPTEIPTLDVAAIADTFDARAAYATNEQRAIDQTATAILWTPTPTQNITATIETFRTQRALELTATATLWTATLNATSLSGTSIAAPLFVAQTAAWIQAYPQQAVPTPSPIFTPTMDPLTLALEHAQSLTGTNNDWKALYPSGFVYSFEDGIPMVLVPRGCFTIGAHPQNDDEQNGNQVCFDVPFWIDKAEVTQADFIRLGGVKANVDYFDGQDRPVEQITWFEARDFCAKLGTRLPTEAEWEYAARGPDDLEYPWGNSWNPYNAIWLRTDAQGTAKAGSIAESASWTGALDMSGNVLEWTSSFFQPYPYYTNDGREDQTNNKTDVQRVIRGGSWASFDHNDMRAAHRYGSDPTIWAGFIGFRCANSLIHP